MNKIDQNSIPAEMIRHWTDNPISGLQSFGSGLYNSVYNFELDGKDHILTQNGRITGILDFDRGMYGDPELEFAVLDTYSSATKDFFEGYGQSRPNLEDAEIRRVLYLVYEMIKYAFIRLARGGSYSTARMHIGECRSLIETLM